jgi:hypothetical protein
MRVSSFFKEKEKKYRKDGCLFGFPSHAHINVITIS